MPCAKLRMSGSEGLGEGEDEVEMGVLVFEADFVFDGAGGDDDVRQRGGEAFFAAGAREFAGPGPDGLIHGT